MADSGIMRVKEGHGFAVATPDGFGKVYEAGKLLAADDPIIKSHAAYLEPVESGIEQATAAPGEKRKLSLRHPERHTVKSATEAHPTGAHKQQGEDNAASVPAGGPEASGVDVRD